MVGDSKLWESVGRDDYDAFDLIVDRYFNSLVSFAFSITKEYEKSQDIVQDIFVNLWLARHRNKIGVSLRDYLYTSTRNRSINQLRSETRSRKLREKIEYNTDDLLGRIIDEEARRLLSQAVECLPERNREVIRATLDGEKQDWIAAKLNTSVRTVKSLKQDSIRILREALDDDLRDMLEGRREPVNALLLILSL